MSTPTTRIDNSNSSITPEESLKFVEAGMNLAGHVTTDPHLQELLRQLAHHEISFEALRVGRLLHPRNARPPEPFHQPRKTVRRN